MPLSSRCLIALAIVLSLASAPLTATAVQASPVSPSMRPDSEALLARVKCLTSPALAGRGNGTAEITTAADSIAAWLAATGLQPAGSDGWFQDFPLSGEGLAGHEGRNVVGLLPGCGPLAGRHLVVGAHYDHLGRLEASGATEHPKSGEYFPGANDNASGVTVLVELARMLGQRQAQRCGENSPGSSRGVLFVAFAAEEIGLQGSSFFVNQPPVSRDSIDVMVNFDCVGQLTENGLYVGGAGSAAALDSLVRSVPGGDLRLQVSRSGWAGSDNVSFLTHEVPALFLFTGPYPEYNRPQDDWPTLTLPGLEKVITWCYGLLAQLAEYPESSTYIAVNESASLAPTTGERERRAWLGIIPDFTEQVTGVKLAGVSDGSPAAAAGLAKGDVLVSFASSPVTDLAGLTKLLAAQAPGDQVSLTLLRDGRRYQYNLILADRSQR